MHQHFDMSIGEWLVETMMNENTINASPTSYGIINIIGMSIES